MGIDLGRLKSPLSHAEMVLKMIRELKESYRYHLQGQDFMTRKNFRDFLRLIRAEIVKVDDIAEKTRVMMVRFEEQLKSVEASLNSYRKNIKKRAKEPAAKQALAFVESLLADIGRIKGYIKAESKRARLEEGRIIRNA